MDDLNCIMETTRIDWQIFGLVHKQVGSTRECHWKNKSSRQVTRTYQQIQEWYIMYRIQIIILKSMHPQDSTGMM